MVLNLVKLLVNFYSIEEYSEVDDSIKNPIQECREEANELIMKLKSGHDFLIHELRLCIKVVISFEVYLIILVYITKKNKKKTK
jgi:hypothetical protein